MKTKAIRRVVSLALTLALCLALLPVPARAAIVDSGTCGAEGDNVTWTLDDNGTLTISGTGAMENHNGSSSPFYNNGNIKTVVIGSGVTSVGEYAFNGCEVLTGATIPSGVTSIGHNAFYGCKALANVSIPGGVTSVGEKAFYGCSKLTSAGPIGSGCSYVFGWTTAIPDHAFDGCSGLASVTIPNSVTSIGSVA